MFARSKRCPYARGVCPSTGMHLYLCDPTQLHANKAPLVIPILRLVVHAEPDTRLACRVVVEQTDHGQTPKFTEEIAQETYRSNTRATDTTRLSPPPLSTPVWMPTAERR